MTDNELPGNPFIDEAARDDYETADGSGNAYATLALAYEQRTANLIALWTAPAKNAAGVYDKGEELAGVNYGAIAAQIKERLNLA